MDKKKIVVCLRIVRGGYAKEEVQEFEAQEFWVSPDDGRLTIYDGTVVAVMGKGQWIWVMYQDTLMKCFPKLARAVGYCLSKGFRCPWMK